MKISHFAPSQATRLIFQSWRTLWLVFCGALFLAAPIARAQFTYLTNNGSITITSYTGGGGPVAIPSTITGLEVTDIGTNAFDASYVTSVSIPDTVTNIGDNAFAQCSALGSVTIPNSVISIGKGAFFSSSLSNVMFPQKSLVSIGNGAFQFCGLTSVTIPSSVTNLGQNVFTGDYSMTLILVQAGNKYYSSLGGVLFDLKKLNLLEYPNGLGGNYTVPSTVTNIGYQAFWSCGKVSSVTIPGSVITITSGAFAGCGMTNLTLAKGVTSIGLQGFQGCSGLTSVTIPASVTNLGPDAFQNCGNLIGVFFEGNAPTTDPSAFLNDGPNATAYFLPKTTGWGSTLGGIPTALAQAFFTVKSEALPAVADVVVTGAGTYADGSNATFTASTTNQCYEFVDWTVGGKKFADTPFTFAVSGNETVTANFALSEYTNTIIVHPANAGTVSGSGKIGCGEKVTLKATAKAGFGFAGWSVEPEGALITNNPYIFYASTNETIVAFFTDTQRPTITVTEPAKGAKISASAFAIEGTAKDNVEVAYVYYSLNGGPFLAASTTNGFSNWYANVTLIPNSPNTVSAFAQDTTGNHSTTFGPINFTCTAEGLAPMSIAGNLVSVSNAATNDVFDVSFGPAAYVMLDTNGDFRGEVGTYTYIPTGPNTAELVPQRVLPSQDTGTNNSVLELTFTDAYDATYTNNSGGSGTISFAPTEESVPATLDGVVLTSGSFHAGGAYGSNVFGSYSNTEADSNGGNSSSTYTFTPFTPVAALVVSSYTSPSDLLGVTNYMILTFTEGVSPSAGVYFSASVYPNSETFTDVGSFSLTSNVVKTKFVGPVTVAGLQAAVAPTGESSAFDYTDSFGNGTFASMYIPPNTNVSITNGPNDVGLHLANPRASSDSGVATFIALAPPYIVGHDDEMVAVNWESSSSAISTNLNNGKTAKVTYSTSPDDVPVALLGHSVTAKQTGSTSTETITFTYNNYTNSDGDTGTYTFAPYSPTMALVHFNSINANSGGSGDVLLNFKTHNYVSSKTNSQEELQVKYGTFTFK